MSHAIDKLASAIATILLAEGIFLLYRFYEPLRYFFLK